MSLLRPELGLTVVVVSKNKIRSDNVMLGPIAHRIENKNT